MSQQSETNTTDTNNDPPPRRHPPIEVNIRGIASADVVVSIPVHTTDLSTHLTVIEGALRQKLSDFAKWARFEALIDRLHELRDQPEHLDEVERVLKKETP